MATYVPVATDPADPVSSRFVGSAAEEFRTLKNRTKGALVVPLTDPVPGFIPEVALRAGKGLGFDATGNPVVFTISGTADPSLRADLAAAGGVALVNGAVSQSDLQKQTYEAFSTGGTSTAYTLTPVPAQTAYVMGTSFFVNFHVASGASPTIAFNGIASPPNLVKQAADGTYVNVAANDIPINHRGRVTLINGIQALVDLPKAKSGANIDITSLQGTATNDSAAAGKVGEYQEATAGALGNLVSGTAVNSVSISLTAGDWDVWGATDFAATGATVTQLVTSLNTVSATLTAPDTAYQLGGAAYSSGATGALGIAPRHKRISLAATTTVFLVVRAFFGAGTINPNSAVICARRAR